MSPLTLKQVVHVLVSHVRVVNNNDNSTRDSALISSLGAATIVQNSFYSISRFNPSQSTGRFEITGIRGKLVRESNLFGESIFSVTNRVLFEYTPLGRFPQLEGINLTLTLFG